MRRCRVMVIPWPGGVGAECLYPPVAPCQMAEGQATGLASRIWELIHWFIYSFIQLNIYLLTHFIPVTQIQRCLQSKGSESSYGGLTPRGRDGLSVSNPTQCPLLSPRKLTVRCQQGRGKGPGERQGWERECLGWVLKEFLTSFCLSVFPSSSLTLIRAVEGGSWLLRFASSWVPPGCCQLSQSCSDAGRYLQQALHFYCVFQFTAIISFWFPQ